MNTKDRVEIYNKQIDSLDKETNVIHKKLFVLLWVGAGCGSILFQTQDTTLFVCIFLLFVLIVIATFINYRRLGIIRTNINRINIKIGETINE